MVVVDIVEIASAVGQVASAVIAIPVGFVAWFAYRASKNAVRSTELLTEIEFRREWADRIPQFKIALQRQSDTYAILRVELAGPLMLDGLDEIDLCVRDDFHERRGSGLGGAQTDEEIANHVWGPFRFRPGIDGASSNGRSVATFSLPLGEGKKFAMDTQNPPHWSTHATTASWAKEYEGQPVRLLLRCRKAGFEPWIVPVEIVPEPLPVPVPAVAAQPPAPQIEQGPAQVTTG